MHAPGPLIFWLFAAALVALALAIILPALLKRRRTAVRPQHARANAAVHRSRLAELENSLARGELSAAEHQAEVADLMRRVLEEEGRQKAIVASASPGTAVLTAAALPALAVAIYLQVGNPAAAFIDGETQGVPVAALEQHLKRTPGDGRAWVMLARRALTEDRFAEAGHAYERALETPALARTPQVWCEAADALGMAQGGSLLGRPQQLIGRALALDPQHPCALEMAGSAAVESRDYAAARAYWESLSQQLAVGSAERTKLEAALARVRLFERVQDRRSEAIMRREPARG